MRAFAQLQLHSKKLVSFINNAELKYGGLIEELKKHNTGTLYFIFFLVQLFKLCKKGKKNTTSQACGDSSGSTVT